MKIADLTRRVDELSEGMKALRVKGTRVDWNCLTSQERVLFERVWEIKDEYLPYNPPDDVLAKNHDLFIKGIELLTRRAIDLFQEATKAYCLVDADKDNESFFDLVFTLRIYWFLHEMSRHFERNRKEEELLKKYEDSKKFGQVYNDWLETMADKTALWSPESFEQFIQPLFDAGLRQKRKRRVKQVGSK